MNKTSQPDKDNLREVGEHEGFVNGWYDGLASKPKNFRPSLALSLLGPEYIAAYNAGYLDAYDTAWEQANRFDELLQQRQHLSEAELENDRARDGV